MAANETWEFLIHDGRVYCPSAGDEVDLARCSECGLLRALVDVGGAPAVCCIRPRGERLADRITAVLR